MFPWKSVIATITIIKMIFSILTFTAEMGNLNFFVVRR